MRIILETEKDAQYGGFQGSPVIRTSVRINGLEEFHLVHDISDFELKSHFDTLWEYLGEKMKKSISEKKSELASVELKESK